MDKKSTKPAQKASLPSSSKLKLKPIPHTVPNSHPTTTECQDDDAPDREDYEFFIKEMQRIIDESPEGMQTQFARTIANLQQQRLKVTATNQLNTAGKSKEEIYDQLVEMLKESEQEPWFATSKFQKLLKFSSFARRYEE